MWGLLGDHEIMYDPRQALDRAARLVPGLQTDLIPHAGHVLNSDQPAIVDERILRFL
jgi:pimeloyl-ACP methyl ester carboxylesterase